MKKLSKKSVLLFAAVMALSAFAMPSMASALTWGPSAGAHAIDSSDLSMFVGSVNAGSTCADTTFNTDVKSPASSSLTVTSGTFANCTGTDDATGCIVDANATGFDWNAVGNSTSNVTIGTVNVNVAFTSGCPFAGTTVNVEGTLGSGAWNAGTHSLTFASAGGLNASVAGSPLGPVEVTGTLTDTSGTLTLS